MSALEAMLEQIGSLTRQIREYDRQLETISKGRYPETALLRQVEGVDPLTALTFVLTLEDPYRFEKSRSVGAYLGLVPAQDQSGDRDPQKRISKEGDEMLRRLLVDSARQCSLHPGSFRIGLGPQAPRREDSLSRRQELKETGGGGRSEKTLGATASIVGERRGLRSALQRPSEHKAGGGRLERNDGAHKLKLKRR
jgi:hypothetical protein